MSSSSFSENQDIQIKGAREHNLQDVHLRLPSNELICFTGVSGSGKSSLAFDTLYAEGQRRYIESLSSFARQFLGELPKPDVDLIFGLRPSISIAQKTTGQNPRSTVGTITEINDYLRVLYARVGTGYCPHCGKKISALTPQQILAQIQLLPPGTRFMILAPKIRGQKGEFRDLFQNLLKRGFLRARVDGKLVRLSDNLRLDRQMRHTIDIVVDRLTAQKDSFSRLSESVETALKLGNHTLVVVPEEPEEEEKKSPPAFQEMLFSSLYACADCQVGFEAPTPQLFSFNAPQGMCPECNGLGEMYTLDPEKLIPDWSKSLRRGCVAALPPWDEMGRWRRVVFRGVAEYLSRVYPEYALSPKEILGKAWGKLPEIFHEKLLYGTGSEQITFTGRTGTKWGGEYEGIIPQLLSLYYSTKNRLQQRMLEKYMDTCTCSYCRGERLNEQARSIKITSRATGEEFSLPELADLSIRDLQDFFQELELSPSGEFIARELLKEIRNRLQFLENVGLEYLTLSRTAPTLSGGELQRIRLASQIGSGLVGVLYILDEPSIGLHPRDNQRLLQTLQNLRDLGNTVIVVEHDEETMRFADRIVDFGPGAGIHGGKIVAQGNVEDLKRNPESVTGQFLSGKRSIPIVHQPREGTGEKLVLYGARHHNLKKIKVEFPLGKLICVTGVSGSGKSSLVNGILKELLLTELNHGLGEPGAFRKVTGLEHLDKMIAIDQSPIGRTPRSNPATYIKLFDEIRNLYSELPESKQRGFKPGRFSFNVEGGRCEACQGYGAKKLEMDFLADIWVTCPVCAGKRFNFETLRVEFKGYSIADVLNMDVQQALELFENVPKVRQKLETLHRVGMDYMKLGQPSPTLSGGEAQRIKLARELSKIGTGKTLYILDEPTTGLHFADIELLLKILHNLADAGNTVVIVEHNLDVIKTADWIIDLGPEGGDGGGRIVACGTPQEVAENPESYTGVALQEVLSAQNPRKKGTRKKTQKKTRSLSSLPASKQIWNQIRVDDASQHNLKHVSLEIPHHAITVFCGPSGSGKSSMAMDTIYAEGQRRYVESLSSYARQFVGQMPKPHVEKIEGLAPAIAIEQKRVSQSPRSTVGTVTEIYDYLRILMARLGTPYCPDCLTPIGSQTTDEIIGRLLEYPQGTRLLLTAPREVLVGQRYETLWEELRRNGFVRVRIDGMIYSLDQVPDIDRKRKHDVQVVVDRVEISSSPKSRRRLGESVEQALSLGNGTIVVLEMNDSVKPSQWKSTAHSLHNVCQNCGRSFETLTPNHFSFNTALGWCPVCEGLGVQSGADPNLLLQSPKKTLAEGAIAFWNPKENPLSAAMMQSFCSELEIPMNVPYEQLAPRFRRILQRGTGERWFEVKWGEYRFSFQFKGLMNVVSEAARLVPSLRQRLESYRDEIPCSECGGSRLRDDAAAVRLHGRTIDEWCELPLSQWVREWKAWKLSPSEKKIAGELVQEIGNRVQFLVDVGLDYLTLSRGAPTLSGGEMQRIRLAAQVGSGLCGVLYVLDEPTIGLHPRDNKRLIQTLQRLRNLGNTLLLVEHDAEVIQNADCLVDFGPQAGQQGGEIVGKGTPQEVAKEPTSVTGPFLSGKEVISIPAKRRRGTGVLEVVGARQNNLKNIQVPFPLGTLTAVAGVSGSGKSSLVEDILYASLARQLHRAGTIPGLHTGIRGIQNINKVIEVNQQPIGQTPTSNPATYTGVFEPIRELFAKLPEAKMRGFSARRFSFNVPGGRCETCEGNGQVKIEMHFLPDLWVTCDACHGQRYEPETLAVRYHGYSIADVLNMTCAEALKLFEKIPPIRRVLQTLCDVGLDYIRLGQPAPTLSGGEAQRVKLAAELSRPDTGRTLYILDEPTTGLHFTDLAKLLEVLHRLVDMGNTVIVIEHNLDVLKNADWIIELGPEAGNEGGFLVTAGTPESVVQYARSAIRQRKPRSWTGEFLAPVLASGIRQERKVYDWKAIRESMEKEEGYTLEELDQEVPMPWEVDGIRWHSQGRSVRCQPQDVETAWSPSAPIPLPEPKKWDIRIFDTLLDEVEEMEGVEIDWNDRNVVRIGGTEKQGTKFLHLFTGDEWLLKLSFRVAKETFEEEELVKSLQLKPLNDIPELPLYGREPRVKVRNDKEGFQEIDMRVHFWDEWNTPAMKRFLERAREGFQELRDLLQVDQDEIAPWKKLGRKWHESSRGFTGQRQWDMALLRKIIATLEETAPEARWGWKNKTIVPITPAGRKHYWARLGTKQPDMISLELYNGKYRFPLGAISQYGRDPYVNGRHMSYDCLEFHFQTIEDWEKSGFPEFLKHHLEATEIDSAWQ
ncbi:MAG: excinuclease ABC subunit UvrA [Planctomycetia bacterium]|nr:excinuclease ABC subunit UvrA [Planctomycetia bacterium]